LLALDLEDPALVTLVEQVGTSGMVRLRKGAPQTADLVDRALDAALAASSDPDRLGRLVDNLAGDRDEAIEALRALRRAGPAGVEYCAARLGDADDETQRARLREALVALWPESRLAIYDAMGADDETTRTEAAYALGRLATLGRLRSSLPAAIVVGKAFAPGEAGDAARWAYQQIAGRSPTTADADRRLAAAIAELVGGGPDRRDAGRLDRGAALRLAARLAADRVALRPASPAARRTAAVLQLEASEPIDAESLSTAELGAALDEAAENGFYRAATRLCETLGERGDLAALDASGSRPAPLARALDAAHPATRLAALEAVLAIGPQRPFPGASRVAPALEHFAAARGERLAVVAAPQLARAGQTAGWLIGAGCVAAPTVRGDDAVRLAADSPDTAAVWLDMDTTLPGARETLFRLRRTPATALVPVVLTATAERLADADALAAEHDAVLAEPRPQSIDAVASIAERAAELAPTGLPDAETRKAAAGRARAAIAETLKSGPAFYGLRRDATLLLGLTSGALDEAKLATLARLGTPAAQLRLLDAASVGATPLATREAAAGAFADSVAEHGVLLTATQVRQQYDRYNASANSPAATQRVLGGILDTLEAAAD
ncbi:MAG: hypothetical protein AAF805_10870, partial [Planctomycetota bacterium]